MSEDELRPKVLDLRYPAIAKAALIQGDVLLRADSNGVTLVSGPPLLVQTAINHAKSLGITQGFNLTYHFRITKRGDGECVPGGPPNDVRVFEGAIEIWVYAGVQCSPMVSLGS
jgi:hypothetical protein